MQQFFRSFGTEPEPVVVNRTRHDISELDEVLGSRSKREPFALQGLGRLASDLGLPELTGRLETGQELLVENPDAGPGEPRVL